MGWTGDFGSVREIKQYVLRERNDGYQVLEHASTSYGRNLWVVYRHPKGYEFIALYKMQKAGKVWLYKDMTESCGPVEVDCPLKFLERVPLRANEQYAPKWREGVRQYHSKRKVAFSEGEEVLIYGKRYKVIGKVLRSYRVQRLSDGAIFRAGPSKMEKA